MKNSMDGHIRFFLIIAIFANNSLCALNYSIIHFITKKINQDLKPYQLILFVNESRQSSIQYEETIFQELTQKIPSTKFNLNTMGNISAKTLKITRNLGLSTIYIILLHVTNIQQIRRIQYFLNFIVQLSPEAPRPKCLIIVSNEDTQNLYEAFFIYAWLKKFLNLSIIDIDVLERYAFLHHYNPFYKTYHKDQLTIDTEIFPDKLRNVNGYPFFLSVYHYIGDVKTKTRSSINLRYFEGEYYITDRVVEVTLNHLNFTLKPIIENSSSLEYINITSRKLKNGEVNMMKASLSIHLLNLEAVHRVILDVPCEKLSALVPILPMTKTNVDLSFFVYHFFGPFAIFCLLRIAKIHWNVLEFFGLLIEITIRRQPEKKLRRLIYLGIVLLSIFYSTTLYSTLAQVQIVHENVPFNTFQDIDKSKLHIYINEKSYKHAFYKNDPYVQKIKRKTAKLPDIHSCVKTLRQNRNIICLITMVGLKIYVNRLNDSKIMKVAKPAFMCDRRAVMFETASPYMHKIQKIYKWIDESGIWQKWDYTMFHPDYKLSDAIEEREDDPEKPLVKILIFILGIGCSCSILAFVIEVVVKSVRSCKSINRVVYNNKWF